jgi:thioredoxin-related protein
MQPIRTLLLTCVALTTASTLLAQDVWIQDLAKAKEKAKAEKKDLLMDFTGSDWCVWCKRLDGEVFSKEVFLSTVQKQFVLVKLDYPQDEKLVTPAIKAQNEKLQTQYSIQGYPTVLLADAEGRPYAKTGYQKGGAEGYVDHVAGLKKKGDEFTTALAKAKTGQGIERAKAIDTALSSLEDDDLALAHYRAEIDEIVAADKDGKAGLKAKFEERIAKAETAAEIQGLQMEIGKLMQENPDNPEKALARLDEVIKAKKSKNLEQVGHFFKGMVVMQTKQDAAAAIKELEAAKAVDEKSEMADQIDKILPQLKQMAEQRKEADKADKKDEPKKDEPKKGEAKQ